VNSNTKKNKLIFRGADRSPFYPSTDFVYGFLGNDEVVEDVIEKDRRLVEEFGVTHEQLASVVDGIFETDADEWCGCPLVRWHNIHSPICPWGDFCTKCFLDYGLAVTEIWLVNPDKVKEVQAYLASVTKNVYPIADLARLVRDDWIMVFSDLHPHLIREHHFFEGLNTPYRVNPKRLKAMLAQ